eukprot:scaffold3874_cov114-Isochrysis_galbana.AAC.1
MGGGEGLGRFALKREILARSLRRAAMPTTKESTIDNVDRGDIRGEGRGDAREARHPRVVRRHAREADAQRIRGTDSREHISSGCPPSSERSDVKEAHGRMRIHRLTSHSTCTLATFNHQKRQRGFATFRAGDVVRETEPSDSTQAAYAVVVRILIVPPKASKAGRKMLMLREQSLADPSQPWPAAPFFTAAWKSWERVSSEEGVHELALDKDGARSRTSLE